MAAIPVHRVLVQPLIASKSPTFQWAVDTQIARPQCPSLQSRWYGSKKKTGRKEDKHKEHNGDEEAHEEGSDEMTLDLDKIEKQMSHSVERFVTELKSLRVGRANPAILDHVRVQLKGSTAPLPDLAMVTVKDAHNLIVIPNNPDEQSTIDTSIRNAGLGLNPRIDKNAIIVPVPKPTRESRARLAKEINGMAEHIRTHVRKHRHTALKQLKTDSKEGMSKAEIKSWEKDIQAMTDKYIEKIKDLISAKTREIENS
ncbi:hypothetical protein GGI25_000643 [Coemansia spiralis]|uniref:Ribosome recycling factor domain-containing protein n=2 Tax=Coemansia TaxID=4863 RepID=A0A9W8GE35_9FUNG|nr:hypothetical protein EDC05_000598 [Coemansia umbellata]KAJ2680351.1 hypothetical protein GGI25_000643 [Coemansia spiralis]